ncbi:DNA topoisomerase IA, partial [Acrasis kona]
METLVAPNERDSEAVEARQEIDLRIGAAFTRWQTMRLKEKFAGMPEKPISYGPCQFPTLGFVVQRYLRIKNFEPQDFWNIQCTHIKDKATAEFQWKRGRLFDRLSCLVLYEMCVDDGEAVVTKIQKKEKKKWKPLPLHTVNLQLLATRKLRISAIETMQKAEELYNQGFISYPRTETNKFTMSDEELKALANEHVQNQDYGDYASSIVDGTMYFRPRAGNSDDKAHPPIHPIKALNGNVERKTAELYELIVRHFLACCSKDALGHETNITINIANEEFNCKGLMISEKNYLDVYKYEYWTDKNIPVFVDNERFKPTSLLMKQGKTHAPPLLNEGDLVSLMDKNQIGTDATMAQHIDTIHNRGYIIKKEPNNTLEPTDLGLALVQGYDAIGYDLAKPNLRAKMESDMMCISRGEMTRDAVLRSNLEMYKNVFLQVSRKANILDNYVAKFFRPFGDDGQPAQLVQARFSRCGACGQMMDLKSQGDTNRVLVCDRCDKRHIVPRTGDLRPHQHTCPLCQFQIMEIFNPKTNKTHTTCPYCFKNPPQQDDGESYVNGFRCFNCSANCPMATKRREDVVADKCDVCKNGPMTLRTTNTNKVYVGCKSYPNCKHSVWLPTSKEITMTNLQCNTCRNRGKVYKLRFLFDHGQAPQSVGPERITCVFCDQSDLAQLIQRSGMEAVGGGNGGGVQINRQRRNSPPPAQQRPQIQQRPQLEYRPQPQQQQQRNNQPAYNHDNNAYGKRGRNNVDNRPPKCHCGLVCLQLTCKQGANEGRKFWKCPKNSNDASKCNQFIWDDE